MESEPEGHEDQDRISLRFSTIFHLFCASIEYRMVASGVLTDLEVLQSPCRYFLVLCDSDGIETCKSDFVILDIRQRSL